MPSTLSRYCCDLDTPYGCGQRALLHHLDLPAGAVIDYIGVNTATTVDGAMGFTLHFRDHLGGTAPLASFSFPAHGFATDYAGPLGILIPANVDRVFLLDVEQAPDLEDYQFFGFVEIWWRRVVSDPPADADFRRRAGGTSVLPVHRGAREVRHHRRLRHRDLLPRRALDARADGGLSLQSAGPSLGQHGLEWSRRWRSVGKGTDDHVNGARNHRDSWRRPRLDGHRPHPGREPTDRPTSADRRAVRNAGSIRSRSSRRRSLPGYTTDVVDPATSRSFRFAQSLTGGRALLQRAWTFRPERWSTALA